MKKKTVTGIELSSYLQLLSTDKENCLLHIKQDSHVGIIYMYNGELYDAQSKCEGEKGQHNVAYCEEAVYTMLGWEEPTIEVHPLEQPIRRKILKSLTFLLMESCQRADEQKEKMQLAAQKITKQTSSTTQTPQTTPHVTKKHHDNKQTNNTDRHPSKDTSNASETQFEIKDYFPLIDENEQTTAQADMRQKASNNRSGKQGKKIILAAIFVLVSGLTAFAFLLPNLQKKQVNETPIITESSQTPDKTLPIDTSQTSEKTFVPATDITQTSPAAKAEKMPEQTDNTKKVASEKTPPQSTVTEQPAFQETQPVTAPQKETNVADVKRSTQTKKQPKTTSFSESSTNITITTKTPQKTAIAEQQEVKETQPATAPQKETNVADVKRSTQTKKQPETTGSNESSTSITVVKASQKTATTEQPEIKEAQPATTHQKETNIADAKKSTQTKKEPEATGSSESSTNITITETPQKTITTEQPEIKETQLATALQKETKKRKIADTQTSTQTKKQPKIIDVPASPTPLTIKKTSPPKIIVGDRSSEKITGQEQNKVSISRQTKKKMSSDSATNTSTGITSQIQKTAPKTTNKSSAQRNAGRNEISQAIQDVSHAVEKYKKYPKAARRAGYGGLVKIQIVIDVNGFAVHSALHKTSGRKILDAAAMKAAQKLLNKKVTSASLSEDLSIIVPVRFSPQ